MQDDNEVLNNQLGGINFNISINRLKNHSWQGYIQWLDSGKKRHFRSELELFNLMNEAVVSRQVEENDIRSWVLTVTH